jgi:hypothetical protein
MLSRGGCGGDVMAECGGFGGVSSVSVTFRRNYRMRQQTNPPKQLDK